MPDRDPLDDLDERSAYSLARLAKNLDEIADRVDKGRADYWHDRAAYVRDVAAAFLDLVDNVEALSRDVVERFAGNAEAQDIVATAVDAFAGTAAYLRTVTLGRSPEQP